MKETEISASQVSAVHYDTATENKFFKIAGYAKEKWKLQVYSLTNIPESRYYIIYKELSIVLSRSIISSGYEQQHASGMGLDHGKSFTAKCS